MFVDFWYKVFQSTVLEVPFPSSDFLLGKFPFNTHFSLHLIFALYNLIKLRDFHFHCLYASDIVFSSWLLLNSINCSLKSVKYDFRGKWFSPSNKNGTKTKRHKQKDLLHERKELKSRDLWCTCCVQRKIDLSIHENRQTHTKTWFKRVQCNRCGSHSLIRKIGDSISSIIFSRAVYARYTKSLKEFASRKAP